MSSDTVQKIKERLSIVDVVSSYVKLTKAGRYYKGLSPFNKEKTPSFYVNPERGSYYCFSSTQGGDQFTFIEKMEGVDFKGALKILAEKAGVEIVYEGGTARDTSKLDRMREALTRAQSYYERSLTDDGAAYTYALSRGISKDTIKAFGLGFAPDAWRGLLEELAAGGFTTPELAAAGLIKEADGKRGTWYDRFRNRLMFPIKDAAGRTVAFTGRALDPNDQAKYLNSPETDLFKKSEILFGMDKAKDAIRQRGFALLVEGQFDLLLLHEIGFQNTIALSGTALTPIHLSLIRRYADNLMLCLDSDRAGLAASAKNAMTALRAGMKVKAVLLPKGMDPADLASKDPKDFSKRVQDARPIVEFFLSVLSSAEIDQHKLVLAVEKVVLPLISAMQSPMEQEHFVGVVAKALGQAPDAIRASLPKAGFSEREGSAGAGQSRPPIPPEEARLSPVELRSRQLQAISLAYQGTPLEKRVNVEYARIIGQQLPEADLPERFLFEAGLAYGESPTENAADDLIRAFERTVLTEQLNEATMRLRKLETAQDAEAIATVSRECHDLTTRIAAL